MDEELNYAVVDFRTNGVCLHDKSKVQETIYDNVKTGEEVWDPNPVKPENKKEDSSRPPLHWVVVSLGVMCILLVSVVIILSIRLNTAMSEQDSLTAQNLQLREEKVEFERRTGELTRGKDRLNWTLGVILEYDNFPVETRCPKKVCKPCLDGWVQFQSRCYHFIESPYSSYWETWTGSQDKCRRDKANLVVIESQEEQEFINNHTNYYNDEKHGYWIGLKKGLSGWMWVDGSNVTLPYWRKDGSSNKGSCALTFSHLDPLANWAGASCKMKNRWICEGKALIQEPI